MMVVVAVQWIGVKDRNAGSIQFVGKEGCQPRFVRRLHHHDGI